MNSISTFLKTIRIHQWTKNTLIFLPLLLSHRFLEIDLLFIAILSFLAMCFAASSTYIINDLTDLASDRLHSVKKHRPIANNAVRSGVALVWSGILFFLSILIASFVSLTLLKFIIIYLFVTLAYTYWLKKVVILDVLILAFLYTLRILIGSRVLHIPFSEWLFSFSIFLFCSLGFLKRYNEMFNRTKNPEEVSNIIPGRGYLMNDLAIIQLFGITTGVASILIFVLYINSDQVKLLYKVNYWLWLVAPIFLYWLARMWLIASRGKMIEDPVVFSIKDKNGYFVFILIAFCMIMAKIGFIPL